MAPPMEHPVEQPQRSTPPIAYRSWHSFLPSFSIVPSLHNLMRMLRIHRQVLPCPEPVPADEGHVSVAATEGTSASPVDSEHSGFGGRWRKLLAYIAPRRRSTTRKSIAKIIVKLAEPTHSSSIGEEKTPADSGQPHADLTRSSPWVSGDAQTVNVNPLDLPGPSGLQKISRVQRSSGDRHSSDSDSVSTLNLLEDLVSSSTPTESHVIADPQSIEMSGSSRSDELESAELSKGAATQPNSSDPSRSDEPTTTFSFALPSVPLALAPNRPKPLSLIPKIRQDPAIPPVTSRYPLTVIAGRLKKTKTSVLKLMNRKPKYLPETTEFSRRMWLVHPRYYQDERAAARILDRLVERLRRDDPFWPTDVVRNPTCNHNDITACWLLGHQEKACSLLEVVGYEIVENERQCFNLQHFDGVMYGENAATEYDPAIMEALTFLLWLLERHRCIDSISMGHPLVTEPVRNICLMEMMKVAGKLVTARIGVGSHRLPNIHGLFGDTLRVSFVTMFQGINTLRELCFFGLCLLRSNYDEQQIAGVISSNHSLKTLHFRRCIFSTTLLKSLVALIVGNDKLEDVQLIMETNRDLDLHDEALAMFSKTKGNLKRLSIKLTDGLKAFLGAMASSIHLTHLEVSNRTNIGTLEGLCGTLNPSSSIRHLIISLDLRNLRALEDMQVIQQFATAIRKSKLKVLRLPNSRFTLPVIEALGDALATNTEMRELDLTEAYLRCDLALALVKRVLNRNKTLWELKLGALRPWLVPGESEGPMVSQFEVLDYIVKNTPLVDTSKPEFGPEASNDGHVWISKVYYPEEAQTLLQLMWKHVVFRRIELDFSHNFQWNQDTYGHLLSLLADYGTHNIDVFSLKTTIAIDDCAAVSLSKLIILSQGLSTVTVELPYESSEEIWKVLLEALAVNINVSKVRISGFLQTPSVLAYLRHMCTQNRGLRELEMHIQHDNETFITDLPEMLSGCYTLTEFELTVGEPPCQKPVKGIRKLLRRNLLMINMGVAAITRHKEAPHGGGLVPSERLGGQSSAWAVEAATKYPKVDDMVAKEADCSFQDATVKVREARLSVKKNILKRATVYKGERPTPAHPTQKAGFHKLDVESVQRISTYLSSFDIKLRESSRRLPLVSSDHLWLPRAATVRFRRTSKDRKLRSQYLEEESRRIAALGGAAHADIAAGVAQEVVVPVWDEAAAGHQVIPEGQEVVGQEGVADDDAFAIPHPEVLEVGVGGPFDEELGVL